MLDMEEGGEQVVALLKSRFEESSFGTVGDRSMGWYWKSMADELLIKEASDVGGKRLQIYP